MEFPVFRQNLSVYLRCVVQDTEIPSMQLAELIGQFDSVRDLETGRRAEVGCDLFDERSSNGRRRLSSRISCF